MGTERWRVERNGEVLGWIGYQNTADVWCGGAWSTPESYGDGEPMGHTPAEIRRTHGLRSLLTTAVTLIDCAGAASAHVLFIRHSMATCTTTMGVQWMTAASAGVIHGEEEYERFGESSRESR